MHSYTPKKPPIIYGDTRNLRMAPHNAMYSHYFEHLKMAKIPVPVAKEEAVSNFKRPVTLGQLDNSSQGSPTTRQFSVLLPVDFSKLILPWAVLQADAE